MVGRAGGRAGDAARDPAAGCGAIRVSAGAVPARVVRSHAPGRLRYSALPVLRPVCEELADGPISSRDTQARTEDRAWPEGCAANRNGAPRGVRLIAMRRAMPRQAWRFSDAPRGAPSPPSPCGHRRASLTQHPGRHRAAGMRAADRNPQRKNPYNARRLREIPPSWTVRFAGAGIDSRRA
jgi:hypothetical protein